MRSLVRTGLAVLALVTASFAGVSVTSPVSGSTVTSPTHFVASATSNYPVTAMRIYVDSVSVYTTYTSTLDTYVSMTPGSHYIVVQAWDSTGAVFKNPFSLTVTAPPPSAVTVNSPANNSTVSSPVTFVASATSAYPITAMRIYVDSVSVYTVNAASLNTPVAMTVGTHYVVVQAWDSTGAVFKTPLTLNVSAVTVIPSTATVFSKIDEMTGWQSCTVCAGAGANGPVAAYQMTQGIVSPSMDGKSAKFSIGGSTPYANAIWWKQLGTNAAPTHFVYDLYFYLTNPQAAQALEFDVNHTTGGIRYIMGVQCNIKDTKTWEVWDGISQRWASTGIACPAPPAYQWNHLTEEFTHDSSGHVTFVSITLNGTKYYVNRTYGSLPVNASDLNVAFQMDGDYAQHPYDVWLDEISLSYW